MNIVIVGAGCVGRSLLGRLLCRPEHRVVFVDANKELVRKLNKDQHYLLRNERGQHRCIGPITATDSGESCLSTADAVFVSVGMENLAGALSALNVCRPGTHVVVVENGKDILRVPEHVWGQRGIAECVVPEISSDVVYDDTYGYLVFEGVPGLDLPVVVSGAEMPIYWESKWLQHCALHAVTAYLGMRENIDLMRDVFKDEQLHSKLSSLATETAARLGDSYPAYRDMFEVRALREICSMATNPIDTCKRVGRNPGRKSRLGERLWDLFYFVKSNASTVMEAIEYTERL